MALVNLPRGFHLKLPSKPQSSRTVIRRFHTLLKQQTQLKAEPQTAHTTEKLSKIEAEIDGLGGLIAVPSCGCHRELNRQGGESVPVLVRSTKRSTW